MFNKSKSPDPAPQPARGPSPSIPPLPDLPSPSPRPAASTGAAPAPARGLSTLSSDLKFEGNVTGNGDLQIDGQVKGDVRVGRLIVGETGAIEGSISADYVEVRGRVVGAVSGKQVKLVSTAYVDGDITAEQLSIDIGAYFQGRVLQGRKEAPKPAEPAAQVISMGPTV
ncbi:cell shape determination protein CcmA [Rhizobium sp. CRIBSB]|nr:cell shape determination protein CcmA [Rhizobium sp. CRIBSB]